MNETNRPLSPEELVQLQKKFSEIKHSINNALAVVQAIAEMSQRRPDYAEKLATTVLDKVPQIVSGLREFAQLLNEKAGVKSAVAGEAK
jgi:two-component sensor histidine kinase